MYRARRFLAILAILVTGAAWSTPAVAHATVFSYTGSEQTYTVPAGVSSLSITAIGAPGGGPLSGGFVAGRGAVVSGIVNVAPGQALYVEVGGSGSSPVGGFNGGGDSGTRNGISVYGGGGASDVRTLPMSAGVISPNSRLIVAAGGGGSGHPAASGGDAGAGGGSSPNSSVGGGAGTQTAGGTGGCDALHVGCGMNGSLAFGGTGGSSGDGAQTREGAGGGGGLYGGGGGGGVSDGAVGGGGGGSSLVPSGSGTLSLASLTTAPSVTITPVPPPPAAPANTLYVSFGDSVGAGVYASPGHSYFDLYCAYLKSSALVDHCVNEAISGATSDSALSGGMVQRVVNDIKSSTDTPVVTVSLGGNDLLGSPGCQPITRPDCPFIRNMRTILNQLEVALATRPGTHTIQWLEYYNPNHDNPFGTASQDQSTATLLFGSDSTYTDCASYQLNRIGFNDVVNCVATEKGATPVDAYTPFQANCMQNDCFADPLHPDDKGYGLIFDAFRTTPGTPVPSAPPPDRTWPYTNAPNNATQPLVSGSPRPGSVLTCSPGTWSSSAPLSYEYQWLRHNTPIPGRNTAHYLVQAGDAGHAISCQVTASNADGSASAPSNPVTVSSPPKISQLSEIGTRFVPSSARQTGGTLFAFQLDQAAKVKILIELKAPGRREGNTCRRASRHPGHKRLCIRTIWIGALVRQEPPGRDRIFFSGHVHGHTLKPGRYVATFVASDPAGASAPRRLSFTVIRT